MNQVTGVPERRSNKKCPIISHVVYAGCKRKRVVTCPVIGFDFEEAKHGLNISEPYEVVVMITIGKEKVRAKTTWVSETC